MAIRREALESAPFRALKDVYDHREAPARAFRAAGGRVVAQLGWDVPDELVMAAGMLPVRVCADPQKPLALTDQYLEFSFDPVVRAQFEGLVDGTCREWADYLAVSNSTDVLLRVYLYLREIRRTEPDCAVPPVEFIDWLFTRNRMHQERNEQTIAAFRATVESWTGRVVADGDIRAAAAVLNEDRAALRELQALRRAPQPRLAGSEALVATGAGLFMDRAEHARLCRALAAEAKSWPVLAGPRVYVTGSAQEDTGLYGRIEAAGAVVVGEDHDWGERHFERDTRTDIDPVRAIVDRYMLRSYSAKKAFVSQRVEALTAAAEEAGARGVIFYMNQYEESGSWDYPSQKKALDARGVATTAFVKQRYPVAENPDLEAGLAAFAGSMKGGEA